jgi:hypothetical protein
MNSTDTRFKDAAGDIYQHRVLNPMDWDDDWIFTDSRFGLQFGDDELVLRFLAEMLHPVVRMDEDAVAALLKSFNEALARDGYELYPAEWISGHAVYSWRLRDSFHGVTPELKLRERAVLTDPAVLEEHLARIRDGLTSDPAAAISSSKNLLESLFRIVLDRSQIDYGAREDIPQLYRKVADLLELKAESVLGSAKGSEASQQVPRTLVTTVRRGRPRVRRHRDVRMGQAEGPRLGATAVRPVRRHLRAELQAGAAGRLPGRVGRQRRRRP